MTKSLICITTCNRLSEVKKYIFPYIDFCNKNEGFYFLLALDGINKEYIDFCSQFEIPLIYSDEREGVGLSKNRVLKQFPNFYYYFFIDDDIELLDCKIFDLFISMYLTTGIHHFSPAHFVNATKVEIINEIQITHSALGGGYFNFYSGEGLKKVGGWNTYFAKYKRYGHTEHTYRFFHSGLNKSPFIFIEKARKMLLIHNPPHVTNLNNEIINDTNELIHEEEELIKQKTKFFPIQVLSDFHFNGFNMSCNIIVNDFLITNRRKYPLTNGKERKVALAEYYFLKIRVTDNKLLKLKFLLLSLMYYPLNNSLKHAVKHRLKT